jgi:hypothetical protein
MLGYNEQKNKILASFCTLGLHWHVDDSLFQNLEEYVCRLYGQQCKRVNEARYKMFQNFVIKKKKTIDLSLLPPCQTTLKGHVNRVNYVSKMWRLANITWVELPPIDQFGWNLNGSVSWINEAFPEDIADILLDQDLNELQGSESEDISETNSSDED